MSCVYGKGDGNFTCVPTYLLQPLIEACDELSSFHGTDSDEYKMGCEIIDRANLLIHGLPHLVSKHNENDKDKQTL